MPANNKGTIILAQTPEDRINVVALFENVSPEVVFDYWTDADLLKTWWPTDVELKAESNGAYHFSWPKQNWHLRGKFTEFRRGKDLGFTWKWDHEPADHTHVTLKFESTSGGGTKLTLVHGNYLDNDEGRRLRDEHIEGWMHFLGRLQQQLQREK